MIKKLAKFFWMAAFLIFSFCSFAESAEIQLVSGERLQGDVLSVGEGEMVLGCSWGEAEIKLEAVEEIYFVSREQKVSAKGLLLRDGTNLLGAQLTEKRGERFVFDLPYGKLMITDPEQLLYVNLRSPGGLLIPQGLKIVSCYVLLQSRGEFARERIVGELLQYSDGAFKVRTLQGILQVPEAAIRGIAFAGEKLSLEKPDLKTWDNIPVQGKLISFIEDTWTIEASFGVFLVEGAGMIKGITYPPNRLSPPEKKGMFVSLRVGTDLWGDILAWEDKNVKLSTQYGTLTISSSEILRILSVSLAAVPNTPPNVLSLKAKPSALKPQEVSLITCLAEDSDGGALTYEWAVSAGSIEGSGSEVNFKSPYQEGNYSVEVTVADEEGGKAKETILVSVAQPRIDWSMFRYDSQRSGETNSKGPNIDAALLWNYETQDTIFSSPAVVEGAVYVGSSDNYLYALEATSGKLLWKYLTGAGINSSPAVVEGTVYVGSFDNNLYAVEAKSGELLWKYLTGADINSSPAVAEGTVYVGSSDNNLYALEATSGKLLWKYLTGADINSSPAVAEGTVYVGSSDNNLYAVEAKSGELLWKYLTGADVRSSPAVVEGTVYVGSYDNYLYALEAKLGKLLWKYRTRGSIFSSPAVAESTVYVGSSDNYLYAVEATSGKLLWKYRTGDDVRSSPAVVEGTVYVGSSDNYLYAVEATSGKLLWKYLAGADINSSPAVVEGTVYVGSYDNSLCAVGSNLKD